MLALDRSHAATPSHHSPQPSSHPHHRQPSSSASPAARPQVGTMPSSSGSRRTSSHSGLAGDLPPRSRSTPPVLPHSNSYSGGANPYQQQQMQQQWHAHQQRQQFAGGAGWNMYGASAGSPQHQQQWAQQAMAGLSSQQFFHHQQQQLAAWASAYQQQLMRSGSSPPLPFPAGNANGGGSPYGHPSDFAPPAHLQDPARRRSTSGPQPHPQQQQRSPVVDRASYFPSATTSGGGTSAAHHRHNSFTAAPHRSYTPPPPPPPTQQAKSQQQRQPSPPSSDPSSTSAQPNSAAGGFHPYRRPERKPVPSASGSARDSPTPSTKGGAPGSGELGLPARPYARAEGARSDSSVSSRSSASRADPSGGQNARPAGTAGSTVVDHARGHSMSSSSASGGSISSIKAVAPQQQQRPATSDHRNASPTTPTSGGDRAKPPAKPSPLSQSQAQNEPSRPVARSASSTDIAAKPAAAPQPAVVVSEKVKKGGLMGKFKGKGKAEPGTKANPVLRSVSGGGPSDSAGLDNDPSTTSRAAVTDDGGAADGKRGGLKRTRSLFNMKNASTDNISIASAASSASMMIRKIGSFGKLASRNSISGISNIFKDKKSKDTDDVDGFAPEKKKGGLGAFRSRKAAAQAPAVSRASAELDRESATGSNGGLTPAARLARQHTIKSRAAEEAAAEERRRVAAAAAALVGTDGMPTEDGRRPSLDMPTAWESGTTRGPHAGRVDDGFSESEDEIEADADGSIDDVARRLAGVDVGHDAEQDFDGDGEYADWGRHPVQPPPVAPRSILKQHSSYGSAAELDKPEPTWTRMRSNSSDQSISATAVGGNVLNDLQPDANQIDGVHPAGGEDEPPSLPPLFSPSTDPFAASSPRAAMGDDDDDGTSTVTAADRVTFPYQHPAHNSSAPTLSLFASPPAFNHRSVTAPPGKRKEIAWAPNCAVYHTFHSSEYDRRSEPATCNRLTPALAQEIKLFLNHYKMEEMEIHPSSKAHTHFFP